MLVTYFVNLKLLNDHLFGKELFIQFTMSAFRKLLSIYVFSYFSFGFEDMMWDLIVSVPDHCLSFYFTTHYQKADYYTEFSLGFWKLEFKNPLLWKVGVQTEKLEFAPKTLEFRTASY